MSDKDQAIAEAERIFNTTLNEFSTNTEQAITAYYDGQEKLAHEKGSIFSFDRRDSETLEKADQKKTVMEKSVEKVKEWLVKKQSDLLDKFENTDDVDEILELTEKYKQSHSDVTNLTNRNIESIKLLEDPSIVTTRINKKLENIDRRNFLPTPSRGTGANANANTSANSNTATTTLINVDPNLPPEQQIEAALADALSKAPGHYAAEGLEGDKLTKKLEELGKAVGDIQGSVNYTKGQLPFILQGTDDASVQDQINAGYQGLLTNNILELQKTLLEDPSKAAKNITNTDNDFVDHWQDKFKTPAPPTTMQDTGDAMGISREGQRGISGAFNDTSGYVSWAFDKFKDFFGWLGVDDHPSKSMLRMIAGGVGTMLALRVGFSAVGFKGTLSNLVIMAAGIGAAGWASTMGTKPDPDPIQTPSSGAHLAHEEMGKRFDENGMPMTPSTVFRTHDQDGNHPKITGLNPDEGLVELAGTNAPGAYQATSGAHFDKNVIEIPGIDKALVASHYKPDGDAALAQPAAIALSRSRPGLERYAAQELNYSSPA